MPDTRDFTQGGYRYAPAVFQYSGGVAALPGFAIERARFRQPIAIDEGFDAIAAHLDAIGRPKSAFCACELRSPEPFTEATFETFNKRYVGTLEKWGHYRGGDNAVARSNVCPAIDPPKTPSFYAFSYTVPVEQSDRPTFIIAGSAETPEGTKSYQQNAVRFGDTSPKALLEKAQWVLAEMQRRMSLLGYGWQHVTNTHVYTVRDLHPFLADEIVKRGATPAGLTWHYARPPVQGLEYEMDVRGVGREIVIG